MFCCFSSRWRLLSAPTAAEMAWQAAASGVPRYIRVTRFDPKRNPDRDLAKALAEAKRTSATSFWKSAAIGVTGAASWTSFSPTTLTFRRCATKLRDPENQP